MTPRDPQLIEADAEDKHFGRWADDDHICSECGAELRVPAERCGLCIEEREHNTQSNRKGNGCAP